MQIHELLEVGRENRKSAKQLQAATGLQLRELHEAIRKERREGHFILSSKGGGGYWLFSGRDEDMEELETFCREYRKPATDMIRTIVPFMEEVRRRKQKGA